jgi:hypothetical protein
MECGMLSGISNHITSGLILNLPKKSLQAIYLKQFLTPYNYNKTIFPILQCKCFKATPI